MTTGNLLVLLTATLYVAVPSLVVYLAVRHGVRSAWRERGR